MVSCRKSKCLAQIYVVRYKTNNLYHEVKKDFVEMTLNIHRNMEFSYRVVVNYF